MHIVKNKNAIETLLVKRQILVIYVFFMLCGTFASAQNVLIPKPPIIGAKSYLIMDGTTGVELAALKPDEQLAPASLTKLMTAYAIFRALDSKQISLDELVTISEKAWRTEGSRMFVEVGTRVTIQDLLLGMIVQSGNDASVALAEHAAGTEAIFSQMMNQYAAQLGMSSSNFTNAAGLPDNNHYTTARDMAKLARAIINEFPEYYKWYSVKDFEYNNIKQQNRNKLLWQDPSVDGMKTGYTASAGYCLVSAANRNGMRLISVVLGTSSARARVSGSAALLNYGFRFFETRLLYQAAEAITSSRTWKGRNESTALGLAEDLYITVPRGSFDEVDSSLSIPSRLIAPIQQDQVIGELVVNLNGSELLKKPVLALTSNPNGSLWQRTRDHVRLWFD